jgi:hypothetical protein
VEKKDFYEALDKHLLPQLKSYMKTEIELTVHSRLMNLLHGELQDRAFEVLKGEIEHAVRSKLDIRVGVRKK